MARKPHSFQEEHRATLEGISAVTATSFWRKFTLPEPMPGDTNGDGIVDLSEFNVLKANFGPPGRLDQGDSTADGRVNLADFNILRANFGTGAAIVPEPGALILVFAGMCIMIPGRLLGYACL